jgi:hypothetical protein
MKKLLVVAITALVATSAFAQKSMVRFSGFDADNSGTSTFDVSFGTKDDGTTKSSTNNLALNYAYAVTDALQVGVIFQNNNDESGDEVRTMGLSAYWNVANKLVDTHYVGVHLLSTEDASDNKTSTTALEYGYRFSVGSAWGFNLTYAPAVTYAMATKKFDAGGDDEKSADLTWNFLKFDVLF